MVKQRERVVRGSVSSDHVVQLFDAPESLGEAVAAFLSDSLQPDSRLVVVAKTSSTAQIAQALERRGVSAADLASDGRLTILDAHATLRAIMRHGSPDPALFDARIGDIVVRLANGAGPVRIYGELVEILAEEGNFQAAVELEDLWNQLGTVVPFQLLCGYSSAHFASPHAGSALQHICDRHTRVHQNHVDMLAGWLLDRRSASAALNETS